MIESRDMGRGGSQAITTMAYDFGLLVHSFHPAVIDALVEVVEDITLVTAQHPEKEISETYGACLRGRSFYNVDRETPWGSRGPRNPLATLEMLPS